MKIALFHNLPSGGAKRALHQHARLLDRLGHEATLFTFEGADEAYLPLDGLVKTKRAYPIVESPASAIGKIRAEMAILREHRKIARDIDSGGFDLAYLHPCIRTGVAALARHVRTPTLAYVQEPVFARSLELIGISGIEGPPRVTAKGRAWLTHKSRQEAKNARAVTRMLVNSYHSREHVLHLWGIHAHVCYLGIDPEVFSPDSRPREPFLLSVGQLGAHKGFDFLVRSIAAIPQRVRLPLVVVGNRADPLDRRVIEESAARLGVRLTIREAVSEEELVRHYRTALLFVYAPYLEPFGLAPVEAMASGLPVVAVREGGVRETVLDQETGLLVDRDETEFAGAVRGLLEDSARRERMGQQAIRHARECWRWDASADLLDRHLRQAASAGWLV